jgi:hypothetical protein
MHVIRDALDLHARHEGTVAPFWRHGKRSGATRAANRPPGAQRRDMAMGAGGLGASIGSVWGVPWAPWPVRQPLGPPRTMALAWGFA